MATTPAAKKKLLKELNGKLKVLQDQLAVANKAKGIDDNIEVKVKINQANFERIRTKDQPDKGIGKFFLQIDIKTKQGEVYIPISISSSKKPTGFVYQIEGTSAGTLKKAHVRCRGEGVTQVTVGTLLYAKIPAGKIGNFRIQAEINGKINNSYKIIITRINYKLSVSDTRYGNYLKEIVSDIVKFS